MQEGLASVALSEPSPPLVSPPTCLPLGFLFQSLLDLRASLAHPISESLLGQRRTLPSIQPSASARMFDWIEKVVPQPPVKIHVSVVGEKDAPVEQSAAVDRPEPTKKVSGCLEVAISSLTCTERQCQVRARKTPSVLQFSPLTAGD